LDFLETQVASSVTKVRHAKCSIKANVFVAGLMCTIKVRIYRDDCGNHAVEFQRRAGDCLVFGHVYSNAAKHLASHLPAVLNVPEGCANPCPQAPALPSTDLADTSVLLGLALDHLSPSLQAEAAASLMDLAPVQVKAGNLTTDRTLVSLQELLQSDHEAIAYPAACTLLALSQSSEVALCIKDHGILPTIADRMRCTSTSPLVLRPLAALCKKLVCTMSALGNQWPATGNMYSSVMQAAVARSTTCPPAVFH